jgi:alkanesulfonate monooxygenase SsuD/methylene tetrahydromethanopterin reductase-like flavin-dependent oxidoreductase (luciferase family)
MAGKALFSVGGSSGLVWNDFLEICQACDEYGYHGFYPSDHLMIIQPGRGSGLRLEGLTVMAAMSGHTKNLRLGMLVINNNFRHPVITAKMINTIDHASGGRVEMGIGSGNIPAEFEAHGLPWPKFSERLDRLDESLQVMKALCKARRRLQPDHVGAPGRGQHREVQGYLRRRGQGPCGHAFLRPDPDPTHGRQG